MTMVSAMVGDGIITILIGTTMVVDGIIITIGPLIITTTTTTATTPSIMGIETALAPQ